MIEDVDELSTLLVDMASDMAGAEIPDAVQLGDLARARTERRVERPLLADDTALVEVVARPRQIERAISNLVDNAVKYSPSGFCHRHRHRRRIGDRSRP